MSNANDFIIENGVLKKYVGSGGEVVIPDGVIQVAPKAFYGDNKITSLTICNGVEHIGESAFGHCRQVESINLPDTVKTIENGAFFYCDQLRTLEIPENAKIESVRSIVSNCFNLRSLILPGSIGFEKKYNSSQFVLYGCNRVKTLVYPGIRLDDISKKLQAAALNGFLHYRNRFVSKDVCESYLSQLMKKKDLILELLLRYDDASLLQLLADQGKLTVKTVEKEYLEPAVEANAVQCIQYLLNWKNANVKPENITTAFEKQLNAKPKDPYNAADMRKIWATEKAEDGTLILTSYKGNETEITIPPRIGKNLVTYLGSFLFSRYISSGSSGWLKDKPFDRRVELSRIHTIHVVEGVSGIGQHTFHGCTDLEQLHLPATLCSIGQYAFGYRREDCKKLTIHAPAGSYAETYAKENNIPFVAE